LPLLLSQLSKIVLLNYSTVLKNINAVCVANGTEIMGDAEKVSYHSFLESYDAASD
jgi:hypothetical protein